MKVHDNIRFMRMYKNWTQETMANKLEISTLSYASRLEQIAEVMEIYFTQLFGLNEKNVLHFTGDHHGIQNAYQQKKLMI